MARTLSLLPVVVMILIWLLLGVLLRWPGKHVTVAACDVGQGDAMLITAGRNQLLIDGGPDQAVLDCLERFMPPWDEVIELVVLSHPDLDHYGGLTPVLDEYRVLSLIADPRRSKSADFDQFEQAVSREQADGMTVVTPQVGSQLVMGGVTATILTQHNVLNVKNAETGLSDFRWQNLPQGAAKNDLSIGILLTVGQVTVMAMGDATSDREQALVSQGMIADVDVLKVSHHGSKTSTSLVFLSASRPELAVISSGKNNHFGHPHPEVLNNLGLSGVVVLRTDQLGSVRLITDGESIWQEPTHCSFIVNC